jgi:transcriptional regulator with PAS, ATPase and Fis domain
LDEISEIPMRLQGRLLRAIQEKEIMRLGHDRVIPVDVRIIAATNCSLADQVDSGAFREDLFYRLNILKLELPSLAERAEDIPALVEHWVGAYCAQFGTAKLEITEKAKATLKNVPWPGNIRQLRNVCERMVVLAQCDIIDSRDVEMVLETEPRKNDVGAKAPAPAGMDSADPELDLISSTLLRSGNNKVKAARALGISRTTLWRRMKHLKHE